MTTQKIQKYKFKIGTPQSNPYINALIYGAFGTGKTTLAASAQDVSEMANVLFIDAESGSQSLKDWPDMDVVRINEFMQLAQIYEHLRRHCKARDADDLDALRALEADLLEEPRDTPKKYYTVVLDSLSEMQRYNMAMLLGQDPKSVKLDALPETPEYKQWHQTTVMLRTTVRAFRDLPMNVIAISSERQDEERKGAINVDFPAALQRELPGFFDIVGYLEAVTSTQDGRKVTQRRLNLVRTAKYEAKHRFGRALANETFVADPTMGKLHDLNTKATRMRDAENG